MSRNRRWWMPWVVAGLWVELMSHPALGFQRVVRTRVTSYDAAPVIVRDVSIRLVETFSSPTQFPLAALEGGSEVRVERSRVRYMNRLNQQIPTFLLEGTLKIRNQSRLDVIALEVTTIALNVFRKRIKTGQDAVYASLGPGEIKDIAWSKNLPNEDIFELVFVVTAVRFIDGTVWAPTEELLLAP